MTRLGGESRQIDGDAAWSASRKKPPKVWFCQREVCVRANVERTTIQGLLDSSVERAFQASASRWGLRRVTAHVPRPTTPPNRSACLQAAFCLPLRAAEAGALRRAAFGFQRDGAPSPASLTRLMAPDAHAHADVGWRQVRVQVSARAPLLTERLSRH